VAPLVGERRRRASAASFARVRGHLPAAAGHLAHQGLHDARTAWVRIRRPARRAAPARGAGRRPVNSAVGAESAGLRQRARPPVGLHPRRRGIHRRGWDRPSPVAQRFDVTRHPFVSGRGPKHRAGGRAWHRREPLAARRDPAQDSAMIVARCVHDAARSGESVGARPAIFVSLFCCSIAPSCRGHFAKELFAGQSEPLLACGVLVLWWCFAGLQ
jgi:hypothetical protein